VADKTAGQTQVAWALLTEGVAEARVEAHRLRHLMTRALKIVEKSPEKDHLYQVAGDIIMTAPQRLDKMESTLDRLSYALSVLGTDHLRDRLSLSDRAMVDDAVHQARPFASPASPKSTARVAYRYLMRHADLMPPLGFPGGPCHVVQRIYEEVKNPRLRDELIEDIETGGKLDNQEASKVYDLEVERGPGGKIKKVVITAHGQFRMDQRGITVPEVRMALQSFVKRWMDLRSQQSPIARRWEMDMMRGDTILWTDPRHKLTIVFTAKGDTARLVTTYWEGQSDPKARGEGSCPLPR